MEPRPRRNRPGTSTGAVEAVRDDWDRLADRTGAAPFLRPGWIGAWWRAFGAGRLEVLRAEEEDRVRALLPVRHRHGAVSSPSNCHSPRFGLLREDPAAGAALLGELFARRPAQVSLGFRGRPRTRSGGVHRGRRNGRVPLTATDARALALRDRGR